MDEVVQCITKSGIQHKQLTRKTWQLQITITILKTEPQLQKLWNARGIPFTLPISLFRGRTQPSFVKTGTPSLMQQKACHASRLLWRFTPTFKARTNPQKASTWWTIKIKTSLKMHRKLLSKISNITITADQQHDPCCTTAATSISTTPLNNYHSPVHILNKIRKLKPKILAKDVQNKAFKVSYIMDWYTKFSAERNKQVCAGKPNIQKVT